MQQKFYTIFYCSILQMGHRGVKTIILERNLDGLGYIGLMVSTRFFIEGVSKRLKTQGQFTVS